jgi:hypothetical protein
VCQCANCKSTIFYGLHANPQIIPIAHTPIFYQDSEGKYLFSKVLSIGKTSQKSAASLCGEKNYCTNLIQRILKNISKRKKGQQIANLQTAKKIGVASRKSANATFAECPQI